MGACDMDLMSIVAAYDYIDQENIAIYYGNEGPVALYRCPKCQKSEIKSHCWNPKPRSAKLHRLMVTAHYKINHKFLPA